MPVQRIAEFDTWRPGYGASAVAIYVAGTQTLADVYLDEALTIVAANPQTLQTRTVDDIDYGKFTAPVYTSQAYYLAIDNADNTGIIRPPITTLDAQEAGEALATPDGATRSRELEDILGEVFYAESFGTISASAATNTTTITAAIGAAAAAGGGEVILPAGTIDFNQLNISTKVILRGRGMDVTTLRSTVAGNAVTFSGDRCGLADLTLDGSTLVASSVGVFSKSKDETLFERVKLTRFETCLYVKGARRSNWNEFYIDNAVNGAKLHGDLDTGNGSDGDEFRNNSWTGGKVSNCTTFGVNLEYIDKKVWHNLFSDIGFEDNTGTAFENDGARHTDLEGCWWSGNTTNLNIKDGDDTDAEEENSVINIHFDGGSMDGGAVTISGTAQDVIFDKMEISDVDFTLSAPLNNILLRDSIEDDEVTISGTGTRIVRVKTVCGDAPTTSGVTTNNSATKAWSFTVAPGQVGWVDTMVVASSRNTEDYALYHLKRGFRRPGSTLAFDAQTANFSLGDTITGATSGATGRLVAQTDAGATGSLTLKDIDGEFIDNEIITSNTSGSATANGVLSHQSVALLGTYFIDPVVNPTGPAVVDSTVETDTNCACVFVATAEEIEIHVTGVTNKIFDWVVSAKVIIN